MNNIKKIQEFNRRKIICAVHNTEDYEEALKEDEKLFISNTVFSVGNFTYRQWTAPKNAYKKLGKPLTLSRVLLALRYKQIGFFDDGLIEVIQTNGYYKEDYNHHICDWDLEKETLEEQSPETQISIAKLLGYER
jgi:hypothetical protein